MPIYQVIILAIIQAVTEFLPISSSAHLELAPWLFGWKDPGLTFDVALHVGTLVAILIYFFKDWVQIVGQGFGLNIGNDPELKKKRALLWLLSAASIAAAALKKFWDIHKSGGIAPDMKVPFVLGIALSGILGAVVIAVFLKYLRRNSLMPFVYYRIVFGIIVVALAVFRVTAE